MSAPGLLSECPGAPGLLLHQVAQDLNTWGQTPLPDRGDLFLPGTGEVRMATAMTDIHDRALQRGVEGIIRALYPPLPAAAEELVSLACRQVSRWADDRGLGETAVLFAEAGALAAPADATAIYSVAALVRRWRDDPALAEPWWQQVIALAERDHAPALRARALLSLGTIQRLQGDLPGALAHYTRGLLTARGAGIGAIEGEAHHDMFVASAQAGEVGGAHQHAAQALQQYRNGHPRLLWLCHDVAYFWLHHGLSKSALAVFHALLPLARAPEERMRVASGIARAAGVGGAGVAFEQARNIALAAVGDVTFRRELGGCMLDLAYGAVALERWEDAQDAAIHALQICSQMKQGRAVDAAADLLHRIGSRKQHVAGEILPRPTTCTSSATERLTSDLLTCLGERALAEV